MAPVQGCFFYSPLPATLKPHTIPFQEDPCLPSSILGWGSSVWRRMEGRGRRNGGRERGREEGIVAFEQVEMRSCL